MAVVLAVAYLAYDVALSRGADLPGGDLRTWPSRCTSSWCSLIGSLVTYLVVPQPTGSGTVVRRSALERGARVLRRRADRLPRPGRRGPGDPAAVRLRPSRSRRGLQRVPERTTSRCSCKHALAHPYHSAVRSRDVIIIGVVRLSGRIGPCSRGIARVHRRTARRAAQALRCPGLRAAAAARPGDERPFDPDELPIEAYQTDEEREFAAAAAGTRLRRRAASTCGENGQAPAPTGNGLRPRTLSLRAIAGRLRGGG